MAAEVIRQPGAAHRLHAALPMYDWPEVAPAWDAFWAATRIRLAGEGIRAEEQLERDGDFHAMWLAPDLILGQTCGWPYVSMLREYVVPVGRFDFGLPTRRPGDYFSVFIMHPDNVMACDGPRDLAPLLANPSTVIAVNSTISQSGFRVFGECLANPITIPERRLLVTGSHRESIRAVADGRAAIASIDAATWQFALAHEPAAQAVATVARSAELPGLPLIVAGAHSRNRDAVLRSVEAAIGMLADTDRRQLCLAGVAPANRTDYDVFCDPPYGNLRVA